MIAASAICRRAAQFAVFVICCLALQNDAQAELKSLWKRGSGIRSAPDPLIADLDLDRRNEIVQCNGSDLVMALDFEDGHVVWEKHLGGNQTLLTPVAGHFLGNGSISVVVPTTSGQLYLLDGSTGDVLENQPFNCAFPLIFSPTVIPLAPADPSKPDYREGLLLFDDSQKKLWGYTLTPTHTIDMIFQPVVTVDSLAGPPVIGRLGLTGGLPDVAYVTTSGRLVAFSSLNPALTQVIATLDKLESHKCEFGLTLGDLTGDGNDDVVIADSGGYLHAYAVKDNVFVPVWHAGGATGAAVSKKTINQAPKFPPAMIDVNGDKIDDILIPREQSIELLDGKTGASLWGQGPNEAPAYGHPKYIQSQPALFTADDNQAYAAFCDDANNLCLLRLKTKELAGTFALGATSLVTPLVSAGTGGGQANCYTRTLTDGLGRMVGLGVSFKAGSKPWSGWRGGPSRSLGPSTYYEEFTKLRTERLTQQIENLLSEAKKLGEASKWKEALDKTQAALNSSPSHHEALSLHRRYYIRLHLTTIILAALGALLVVGYVGWTTGRYGSAKIEEVLAKRALAAGKPERAIKLLYKLCMRFPKRKRYVSMLAEIFIERKTFGAQSANIFERARYFFPDKDRYLKAVATSYASIPRFDEPAADVYLEMARITKKSGPWYFILGQTLQQNDRSREALEAFRQAIMQEFDDPRLPNFMADLYIKLGITSPEILPTLDRVLEGRKEDRAFLKTYCQACQEARRFDEQAQQVATLLLVQDPASPPAHVILATRLLQAGLHKDAMQHAQEILQVNPNDPVGLRLLGACYAAERRLDETAMKIFAKALESNPEAPEILVAVSHGFAQEHRQDAEACGIYRRALVHSPHDETILNQLAEIASRETDDDLTIRAVEPLLAMGRHSRELMLQLANAYCRLGIVEDKAEPIYREALILQPDHATIQDNLAAIYIRKGRIDAEAAQVFEPVIERHPERFDIGLQLARCYIAADLPEKAIALGEKLNKDHPDSAELRKLLASASDKADQMDSAIAGYEAVLAQNPHDVEALCALSSLYGRRRRCDNEAIEVYNQAIQLQPSNVEHHIAAARAYADRDSWDHVIQTIKYMLTQAPGQIGAAVNLMESLVDSSPKALALRWYLIDTLIFDGRLREARRQLSHILRVDPQQAETALLAFDKILEKNPKDALSHLERGRILMGLGRERDARMALEQAHRYHPDNEEIIRALLGLYQKMIEGRDSPEIRFQLGRLAMRVDKYDLAISCFQVTSRDYRWEGESVRNLARCFMAKGMLDLSLQELKRLPMENDVKELLYELGQRYEGVQDVHGAREVYKLIFASDITFRDVKGKLETLVDPGGESMNAERTAIINSLSEEAKRRYELIQELGRGSMGIVYKAHDNELDEVVALKLLPDNLIRNTEAVRRFKQEARNARKLSHPNIVRIHDIGEEMGRKYISMEFIHGWDLKQKLRKIRGPLPYPTVLAYAKQICEAMVYAHSIGIVHRDIKPANLMLTQEDQIKVSDFGIAKMMETSASPDATQQGAIIGTPLYMSPEQVKGQQVDNRADIYSMGVVFYELISGRPPFTEGDLAYQHLFVEPKPLSKDIPAGFVAIIMKSLAKEKEKRWQNAGEMVTALNALEVPA